MKNYSFKPALEIKPDYEWADFSVQQTESAGSIKYCIKHLPSLSLQTPKQTLKIQDGILLARVYNKLKA